ncbi:hypothetical protein ABW19_dt0204174 [Dactylella cylindrospora]|nr:hypothetical protein ABW19_dt0204174 [Dactylella cylindrospora]
MGIFSVGALVCVFSGLRFYYLRDYWDSSDPTWVAFHVSIMSCLEGNVGIITASIPAVKPLFSRLFPGCKFLQTVFNRGTDGHNGDTATDPERFGVGVGKLEGAAGFDSYSTTVVGSNLGYSRRELSDVDLGFPDGFDGKLAHSEKDSLERRNSDVPRIGTKRAAAPGWDSMGWIDREIDMAAGGLDIESFKRGNQSAKMDLQEALRGGPVGIIPEPLRGIGSRRSSDTPYGSYYS